MEAVDKMRSWILEKAEEESDSVIANAKNKAETLTKENDKTILLEKKMVEESFQKKAEQQKTRIMASGRVKMRQSIMDCKEEIIEKAFERAEAELIKSVNAQNLDYKKALKTFIFQSLTELQTDIAVIYCSQQDFNYLNGKELDLIKVDYENTHDVKITFELRADNGIVGGVILELPDKTKRVDHTILSLLAQKKDELRPEVSKILFGNNNE